MITFSLKTVAVSSEGRDATMQTAQAIAEVFSENWLAGAEDKDVLTVVVDGTEYSVKKVH